MQDGNVHLLRRLPRSDGPTLPRLAEPDHRPGVIDLVGAAIRDRGWLVIVGAAVGAVLATFTAAGVVSATILGAAAGFALGGVRSQLVALRLGRHRPLEGVELPPVVAETLRVMELNVHGGMGGPKKFFATPTTLDRLAEAIRAQAPDIVLLQELDDFAARSNLTDTLRQLVRRLHPSGAVMTPAAEKIYGRREGTGILTFGGIVITDARGLRIGDVGGDGFSRRTRWTADMWSGVLTQRFDRQRRPFGGGTEYQPRAATDAMVTTPRGNWIRVLSGHFSPPHDGVDEPERQVRPVTQTLRAWNGPTIVGADFNVRDGSPEFTREHQMFDDVGFTESTAGAPANSDRIYASAHFRAADPRKVPTPAGQEPASDHAPVVVDLHLH